MMPQARSIEALTRFLQEWGAGRGLTVAELQRALANQEISRSELLEALRSFEEAGDVVWCGERARWIGAIPDDAWPFGIPYRRLARDLALSPQQRVSAAARLSEALIRRTGPRPRDRTE